MHSQLVIGIAIGYFKNGKKEQEIEDIFSEDPNLPNVHRTTIKNWILKYQKEGAVQRVKQPGRPNKFSEKEQHHIIVTAKRNRFSSMNTIINETGLQMHHQTLQSTLKNNGLYSCKVVHTQYVSPLNRRQRRIWFKLYGDWTNIEWRKVLFSDENAFKLQKAENNVRVIREKRQGYNPAFTKPRFKATQTKIHVWGIISKKGVGPLVFLDSTVTKDTYMELLDAIVIDYIMELEDYFHHPFVWQHDNAPAHDSVQIVGREYKTETVIGWFQEVGIQLLKHPGNSPDLNPIENLWDIIDNQLRKEYHTTNVSLVKCRIEKIWYSIPRETVLKLLDSMPKRAKELKVNKFYPINY